MAEYQAATLRETTSFTPVCRHRSFAANSCFTLRADGAGDDFIDRRGIAENGGRIGPSYGRDNYGGKYSAIAGTPTDTGAGNNASAQISQAQDLADFMFGNRNSYSLTNFFIASMRQRMNLMDVQDDIKVMPNLMANAGLRYELATPQY